MVTAIYPGNFDPPTLGHLDIIIRAATMFDEVVVCVMESTAKHDHMFSCKEKTALLEEITANLSNVRVDTCAGLLTDYVSGFDSAVVIRGMRAIADFSYEFQKAAINKKLNPNVETMFMFASGGYSSLSSGVVRELDKFGTDLERFVPEQVLGAIHEKTQMQISKTTRETV